MIKHKRKKILIACDSYRTLLGFRGKLMEALLINNDVAVFTPKIHHAEVRKIVKYTELSPLPPTHHHHNHCRRHHCHISTEQASPSCLLSYRCVLESKSYT